MKNRMDGRIFWGLLLLILMGAPFVCAPIHAAHKKHKQAQVDQDASIQVGEGEEKQVKDDTKFPIGCTPVGYEQDLKVLTLFPGKEGALQSMYFFYNLRKETVSLYQMQGDESEHSLRLNHSIQGGSWAVLATGERNVKFICTLGDGKAAYGPIVNCADTVKVCEYVHVKFGLNNKGNFWIVNSNTRNGAVNEVVHYGIIPGV